MKQRFIFMFVIMLIIPFIVSAETTEEKEIVGQTIKYFRTDTIINNSSVMRSANMGELSSITVEVTKEEFDSVEPTTEPVGPITGNERAIQTETTYKRLTTYIIKYGQYYQYETNLYWKNIPKVRSYDIISIGHYNDVELYNTSMVGFSMDYCRSTNECYTSATGTEVITQYGTAVVFSLPTSTIISLEQTLYLTVKKAVSRTITEQIAAGDYAHATKTVSSSIAANNITPNITGLFITPSIANEYYDTTPAAIVEWEGSW